MHAGTRAAIDAYWMARLGVGDLASPGVAVAPHGGAMTGYHGVYAFVREGTAVVTAPEAFVARVRTSMEGRAAAVALDGRTYVVALGDEIERFVGPAWIGYADASDFRQGDMRLARLLGRDDDAALRALAGACGGTAWQHGGIEFDREPVFGCFADGELAAAASYEVLEGVVAHVGFVTHPERRSRGFGRAVASAVAAHALTAGLIAQWQTLESNLPSLAVGQALGFQAYCRTLAIRLK